MLTSSSTVTDKMNRVLPPNRQGIVLDVASILLNLLLFPFFTSRIGLLFDQSFKNDPGAFKALAILMLLILVGRLGGLYLKRFPLQARRTESEQTHFQVYFFILNVPVLVLTAAFTAVIFVDALAVVGLLERGYGGTVKEPQVVSIAIPILMFCLMALEVYLLYRLSRPLNEKEKLGREKGSWIFGWRGEILADFGLFAYMVVWQVFHNQTVAMVLTPPENVSETLSLKIGGLFFASFSFLVFYLSPRTVFLIEDRKYVITWLLILLVFASSIAWYV